MTNLLQRNDSFVTAVNKCSENPTVHLNALCNSSAKIACCCLSWAERSLWGQLHPKCERAIRLVYPPFFCKLRPSPSKRNKTVTALGLEIQTALCRWPFRIKTQVHNTFFFLTMTDTITSKNTDLSSWITLYKEPGDNQVYNATFCEKRIKA